MRQKDVHVVCLAEQGELESEFHNAEIQVHMVGMSTAMSIPKGSQRVTQIIRNLSPSTVQGFMYLGDAFAGYASARIGVKDVFWSIRTSSLPAEQPRSRRALPFLLAPASYVIPKRIISCSPNASRVHISRGYDRQKIIHIPNSIDEWYFSHNSFSRLITGTEGSIRFGLAARYEPGKGHLQLIRSAQIIGNLGRKVEVSFIGKGTEPGGTLQQDVGKLGMSGVSINFGGLRDLDATRKWMSEEIDLYVMASSSWEAFPNSLAEAAALGVPCLATQVGESWSLIPKIRRLVSHDPKDWATSILALIDENTPEQREIIETHRKNLQECFSQESVTNQYLKAWGLSM